MNRSRFLTLIAGGKKKPFDADRFVLLVDSEESGVSGSDQFEITGAEVSTGTTFPVRFSPEADPFDFRNVTVDVSDPTITFPTAGRYFVQIGGAFNRIQFSDGGDKDKLLEIVQWGDLTWSSFSGAFRGCENVIGKAVDVPNLSNVNSLIRAFDGALLFNQDISKWDVSNVEFFQAIFRNASSFNQNLSNWDITNVQEGSGFFTWFREIFRSSAMSCENYTDTLVSWINQAADNNITDVDFTGQNGNTFATSRSGGANFADAGEARTFATTPVADGGLGWTITADTVQTNC